MLKNSKYWIEKLDLKKHPEGGYFKEVYRSEEIVKKEHLPKHFSGNRCFSTSIYFLLEGSEYSAFHKIMSDEIWHFYSGTSLTIFVINNDGKLEKIYLGNKPDKGEKLQAIIKKGCWFAVKVNNKNSYGLVGCTVAPGFDFNDFELAKKDNLIKLYPEHKAIIEELSVG